MLLGLPMTLALAIAGFFALVDAERGAIDHSGALMADEDGSSVASRDVSKEASGHEESSSPSGGGDNNQTATKEKESNKTDGVATDPTHEHVDIANLTHRLGYRSFRDKQEEDLRQFAKFPKMVTILEEREEKVIDDSEHWKKQLETIEKENSQFKSMIKTFGTAVKEDHVSKLKKVEGVLHDSGATSSKEEHEDNDAGLDEDDEDDSEETALNGKKETAQERAESLFKTAHEHLESHSKALTVKECAHRAGAEKGTDVWCGCSKAHSKPIQKEEACLDQSSGRHEVCKWSAEASACLPKGK